MLGKTLQALAVEIERQSESKKDYLAPAQRLELQLQEVAPTPEGVPKPPIPVFAMQNGGVKQFGMTPIFNDQLATRLEIPTRYYDRMLTSAPALLAGNVNHWLQKSTDRYMVRTLDGKARAFLSDRYRPLDNVDLAEAVLPIIADKKWEIRDCDLTERRLYIKIVSKDLQAVVVRPGGNHVVHPGLMIANSEVGLGAVKVTPSLHWPHCFNIALMDEAGTSRIHTGKKDERFGDLAAEFFTDDTRKQADKAFWMKVRDIVSATITQDLFTRLVEKFQETVDAKMTGNPIKVVEVIAKKLGFTEVEKTGVLKHLIEGGDLNLYGLSAAITKTAQENESYDRATDLERFGGEIIELSKSEWNVLQVA